MYNTGVTKIISILTATTVLAILFWFALVPWLGTGGKLQNLTAWLPPFFALIVLSGAMAIGVLLFERKSLWLLMALLADLPIFAVFGIHALYLIFIGFSLLCIFYSGNIMKRELSERYKVDIRVMARAGMRYIILPFLIGVSFVYFFSPQIQARANANAFPESFQRAIVNGVQQVLDSGNLSESGISGAVAKTTVNTFFDEFNSFLEPYSPYLPPLFAFGLFIVLWGMAFIFNGLSALVARMMFVGLRKVGFVKIEEVDVRAERIIL